MKRILLLITLFFIGINLNNANLVKVTESNWERHLSSNEWMIKFYAPWCPACTRFERKSLCLPNSKLTSFKKIFKLCSNFKLCGKNLVKSQMS